MTVLASTPAKCVGGNALGRPGCIRGVTIPARARETHPSLSTVAVDARGDEVAPLERVTGLIVVEADQPPAIGLVTGVTLLGELARVWIGVAGGTALLGRSPVCGVTAPTGNRAVASLEVEAGAAMVEGELTMGIGEALMTVEMAGGARRAEVAMAGGVAGGAGRGPLKQRQAPAVGALVAVCTGATGVWSLDEKAGQGMVESGDRCEARVGVAGLAGGAEASPVSIDMAAGARGWEALELSLRVAARAGHRAVLPVKRKGGVSMSRTVEGRGLPSLRGVAGRAGGAHLGLVWIGMTVHALGVRGVGDGGGGLILCRTLRHDGDSDHRGEHDKDPAKGA